MRCVELLRASIGGYSTFNRNHTYCKLHHDVLDCIIPFLQSVICTLLVGKEGGYFRVQLIHTHTLTEFF